MNNIVYIVIDDRGYIAAVYWDENKAEEHCKYRKDLRILEFEVE